MGFNPEHRYRRSNRLVNYDYSLAGAYFITICTQNRQHYFGEIADGKMALSSAGEMVDVVWQQIPAFYSGVTLGKHIVMPNHIHGIVHLTHSESHICATYDERFVGADPRVCPALGALAKQGRQQNQGQTRGSAPTKRVALPGVVQRFKALTTKRYIDGVLHQGWPQFDHRLWQRNYHEHIIRSENAYLNIANYIEGNPLQWLDDVYHTPLQNTPANCF
jgi:putative transposase